MLSGFLLALGDFAVSGVDLARFGSRFGSPNQLRHTVWMARTTKCLTSRQTLGSEDKMVARRLIWEIGFIQNPQPIEASRFQPILKWRGQ